MAVGDLAFYYTLYLWIPQTPWGAHTNYSVIYMRGQRNAKKGLFFETECDLLCVAALSGQVPLVSGVWLTYSKAQNWQKIIYKKSLKN